jgi:protein involved in polysaccharide export with SLBB domain
MGADLRPLLDEELGRLPEKYRAPLVLCLLEAKSRKEAAGLLGWSEGTLSGRLARAKELLGARLRRRGVAPAGVALLAALAESAAAAKVPASLAVLAVKAAAHAGSTPVVALTEEVMKAMLAPKLKAVTSVLVLVAGIGLGAAAAARQYGPAAPAEAGAEGKGPAVPETKAEAKLRAYVIEPPDVLLVEYATRGGNDPVKIDGQRLVRPDGTIGLGQLGSVSVSGRTLREAHGAITEHLASRLDGFDPKKLTVDVVAYNSKVIYVIAEGADGGEQVYRFPATGNEAVLDVIPKVMLIGICRKRICIRRISDDHKRVQVLSVDWEAITKDGNATTNYQLRPGDRVHIESDAPKKTEGARRTVADKLAGPGPVQELEAVLKAFREARSPEEQRRAVENLEVLTKKLRKQLNEPRRVSRP